MESMLGALEDCLMGNIFMTKQIIHQGSLITCGGPFLLLFLAIIYAATRTLFTYLVGEFAPVAAIIVVATILLPYTVEIWRDPKIIWAYLSWGSITALFTIDKLLDLNTKLRGF